MVPISLNQIHPLELLPVYLTHHDQGRGPHRGPHAREARDAVPEDDDAADGVPRKARSESIRHFLTLY